MAAATGPRYGLFAEDFLERAVAERELESLFVIAEHLLG
jgi:hypothetical protein